MWENVEIDLGRVAVPYNCRIQFNFIGQCTPKDVHIHLSCGCTKSAWNETNNILEVFYIGPKIPPQVVGNQHIRKSVKISYLCNGIKQEDNLFFKAELVNE